MEGPKIKLGFGLAADATETCIGAEDEGPHILKRDTHFFRFAVMDNTFGALCIEHWPDAEWHFEVIRTEFQEEISGEDVQEAVQRVKREYERIKGRMEWPSGGRG